MKQFTKLFTFAALTALLVVGNTANAAGPVVGKRTPKFSLIDASGKKHTDATLKGKVVLLDFWASWCGPCKAASPIMQKLHAKYGSKGLVVIGMNTSEQDDKAPKKYIKEHKYSYTFSFKNDKLAEAWGIEGIPQFYLIDKTGTVRWESGGFDAGMEATLDATIAKLLK